MLLSDFDYYLPYELIAQRPIEERDSSRLMVLGGDRTAHRFFYNLPDFLEKGDTLVINDSRVIPARIFGKKHTGGKVEVLLVSNLKGSTWKCLINGKNIREGTRIGFDGGLEARVEKKINGRYLVSFNKDDGLMAFLDEMGEMPIPPYIKEKLLDRERYQTIYSRKDGSIAAPTAGLHFTPQLLDKISEKGVNIVRITLHVSLGTFMPVKADDIKEHSMESEFFEISPEGASIINNARKSGGRLFAVGTTSLKALESSVNEGGDVIPGSGNSDLFIYPPYNFKSRADGLITNFHLPKSTLIMLVSAFAGKERIFQAYREAVEKKYRFYSFGDAMLIYR